MGKSLFGQNCDHYKVSFKIKIQTIINFNYNFITSKLITNDKKRIMKYKEEIIKHIREKIILGTQQYLFLTTTPVIILCLFC